MLPSSSGSASSNDTVCKPLEPAAANELERLHDELDLADAAGAELHVIGQLAALHFALDEHLHLAKAFEHAVVDVAAIDERADGVRVDLCVLLRRP